MSSIDSQSISQSTLDQHLDWYSVNTQLTSQLAVIWEWTNFRRHANECWLIHMSQSTLGQLPTDCQLNVSLVSTEYRLRCWSSVDQHDNWVSIKGRLRASINARPWIPLVHVICFFLRSAEPPLSFDFHPLPAVPPKHIWSQFSFSSTYDNLCN